MKFTLLFTKIADQQLSDLENEASKKLVFKAVCKTLAFMEANLRHPSLQTHKMYMLSGPEGQEVFEALCTTTYPRSLSNFLVLWS